MLVLMSRQIGPILSRNKIFLINLFLLCAALVNNFQQLWKWLRCNALKKFNGSQTRMILATWHKFINMFLTLLLKTLFFHNFSIYPWIQLQFFLLTSVCLNIGWTTNTARCEGPLGGFLGSLHSVPHKEIWYLPKDIFPHIPYVFPQSNPNAPVPVPTA